MLWGVATAAQKTDRLNFSIHSIASCWSKRQRGPIVKQDISPSSSSSSPSIITLLLVRDSAGLSDTN